MPYLIISLSGGLVLLTFTAIYLFLKSQNLRFELIRLDEKAKQQTQNLESKDSEIQTLLAQKEKIQTLNSNLQNELATLNTKILEQSKWLDEKSKLLSDATENLSNTFKALSANSLKENNASFLQLAKESLTQHHKEAEFELENQKKSIHALVTPLVDSLKKVDDKIEAIEKQRVGAYASLLSQLEFMNLAHQKLQAETSNLVNALKAPQVRGRWGEMTLKRVAELSGMVEHCDFYEQESKNTEDGRLRPDMMVKLYGGKQIVIDAKVPLSAYLQALEAKTESEREEFLKDHARQLQTHMKQLGHKNYWDQFNPTPEFVVMFVPGESFFNAALSKNHNLIEEGMQMKVILASPINLVGLLKTISYGWKQEQLAQNAQEISQAGKILHDRLSHLVSHFVSMGKALKNASTSYNEAIGTLEARILPQARRFQSLGITSKSPLPETFTLDVSLRELSTHDIKPLPESTALE